MARNGIMRRSNLRRIATRIEKIADQLEALGLDVATTARLRAEIATIRREAEANAPKREQDVPQIRADRPTWQ